MPRQMRRAALRSALSVKAAEAGIVVLDELSMPEPKTRMMVQALNALVGDASVLILIPNKTPELDVVVLSARNIPDVKTIMASYLNIRDLLGYDKVLMPLKALDVLAANLA
jgi:large subunit ribosomal protein L4